MKTDKEIQELAEKKYPYPEKADVFRMIGVDTKRQGFISGFKACQEIKEESFLWNNWDDILLKYSKEKSLDVSEVEILIPFKDWLNKNYSEEIKEDDGWIEYQIDFGNYLRAKIKVRNNEIKIEEAAMDGWGNKITPEFIKVVKR